MSLGNPKAIAKYTGMSHPKIWQVINSKRTIILLKNFYKFHNTTKKSTTLDNGSITKLFLPSKPMINKSSQLKISIKYQDSIMQWKPNLKKSLTPAPFRKWRNTMEKRCMSASNCKKFGGLDTKKQNNFMKKE